MCTLQAGSTVDGNGLCCDGEVDQCGVCGGGSTSCGTIVELFAILNMTEHSAKYSVIEHVKFDVEELVAKYLNYPRILVTVKDIDELPDDEHHGPGAGSYGGGQGRYGSGVGGYGDMHGQDLSNTVDSSELIGSQDADAMLAAVKVHGPIFFSRMCVARCIVPWLQEVLTAESTRS